jgi:hypothetical protein
VSRRQVLQLHLEQLVDDALDETTFEYPFDLPGRSWTAEQARVVLAILSDAIRAGTPLDVLRFPYMTMPLPSYDGGPLRCYQLPTEFTIPRSILRNRYGIAARDYRRWLALCDRLRQTTRRRAGGAP